MKPHVGGLAAWSCIVVSVFAIVILSVIGALFKSNHESMMGTTKDPKDGKAVAQTIFITVAVYGGFLVFCGFEAFLNQRQSRNGSISLS